MLLMSKYWRRLVNQVWYDCDIDGANLINVIWPQSIGEGKVPVPKHLNIKSIYEAYEWSCMHYWPLH
jgi:hypothetical protein